MIKHFNPSNRKEQSLIFSTNPWILDSKIEQNDPL